MFHVKQERGKYMLPDNYKKLLIYFDEDELSEIDKLSKQEDRSRVNFIVHAVREYVKQKSNHSSRNGS